MRVHDGLIAEISEAPIKAKAVKTLDLRGLILMPGLCDGHVHVTVATPNFPLLGRWSPFYASARAHRRGDLRPVRRARRLPHHDPVHLPPCWLPFPSARNSTRYVGC